MGLPLATAIQVIRVCETLSEKKSVCVLGVQKINFSVRDIIKLEKTLQSKIDLNFLNHLKIDEKLDQDLFFKSIGFKKVYSLDNSDYEGAEIIYDLNKPINEKTIKNRFDFIYDGGTLEHIFNIGEAIKSLSKLLNKNGIIFHCNPTNGFIDHGFFQISPNFFRDFYLKNNFEILSCLIYDRAFGHRYYNLNRDIYRDIDSEFGRIKAPKSLICFSARRLSDNKNLLIPQQDFYIKKWNNQADKEFDVRYRFILQKKLSMKIKIFLKKLIHNIFINVFS